MIKEGTKFDGKKPDVLSIVKNAIIESGLTVEDFYDATAKTIEYNETMGCKLYLVPKKFIEKVAYILSFGAFKYGENNWKGLKDAHRRCGNAMLRHFILEYVFGEKIDRESKLPHQAHQACNLAFLLSEELIEDQK